MPKTAASHIVVGSLIWLLLSGCDSKPEKPALPPINTAVHVSMRPAALDHSSGVLQIRNLTDNSLAIMVVVKNTENQQVNTFILTIKPYAQEEFGWIEGWSFKPNERVIMAAKGYDAFGWITTRMENGGVGIKEPDLSDLSKYTGVSTGTIIVAIIVVLIVWMTRKPSPR